MSYFNRNDIELINLLHQGNEEAFAEIYNRYWQLLYKTAHNIIQDQFLAQDAVQEVFIALWQRRESVTIQTLQAYLQQAVRFQVLKAIRVQKAGKQFYNRLADVTAAIVYENPMLFKEQEILLKKIMDSIPEDCRLVFQLNREEQLTYKQIAGQLHISEKTVEKKMSICLKHIRQALQDNKVLFLTLLLMLGLSG